MTQCAEYREQLAMEIIVRHELGSTGNSQVPDKKRN